MFSIAWRLPLQIALTAIVVAGSSVLLAADSSTAIQSYLAAGEYGPALNLAKSLRDPVVRDRALAEIATAQAQNGARQASLSALRSIQDDVSRVAAVDRVAHAPASVRGGGVEPDFDTLIELIQSTIAPESWTNGKGAIQGFAGGVWVDPRGELIRRGVTVTGGRELAAVREQAIPRASGGAGDARKSATLRMISLSRLEKQLELQQALGKGADEVQKCLAGITRVRYVFVFPETHDIVIAGPAGDWRTNAEGRKVNVDSGGPVLQLDDLVVTLRNAFAGDGKFGCTITPSKDALAKTQTFLAESKKTPLKPGQRDEWVSELRKNVGQQNVEIYGIDADSRLARVIVEADYRLKLVGMGLEEGTLGVPSYLESVKLDADGRPPALGVLRWWFTLNYQALQATADHRAFELRGPGVKVLSENEKISAAGEREHTGISDELNHQFASNFTEHFGALADKYPVYAELRNVFDLALVAALLKAENLPGEVGWKPAFFLDAAKCPVARDIVPTRVESIVNSRLIGGKHVVAGVSGGVTVDARELVARGAQKVETYGKLNAEHERAKPVELGPDQWWWDP